MARKIETLFLNGPVGRLEALLEEPEDRDPIFAVLVCHPHPQHGGTMHNKVVYRVARGLRKAGAVVLRFNYRGVNLSEGEYGDWTGEVEDARAALSFLRARYPDIPYTLAGFSFGSRIILKLGCDLPDVTRLIAIGFPTKYPGFEFLQACTRDKVFIQSTQDVHGPREELQRTYEAAAAPKRLEWIEAQDHFFAGGLDHLEEVIAEIGRGS